MTPREPRTDIRVPEPGLALLPVADEVFVPDQLDLAVRLHPLVSVDLALVDDEWTGKIHLLSPIEPYTGLIGERTAASSANPSGMLRPNWLPFRLEGDRMRFLGDRDYFLIDERLGSEDDDVRAFALEQHESYTETAAWVARHGTLPPPFGLPEPTVFLEQLGGDTWPANWTVLSDFPIDVEDDAAWPLSPAGRRFRFVAAVPGWHYRSAGADWILLFFEPVERLALLTFDWS